MNKLNKLQASQIAGISQKTLERKINGDTPDSVHFKELTGFGREANGRIYFDEQKFRQYYAGYTSDNIDIDGSLEVENLDTSKNENVTAIVKTENKQVTKTQKPRQARQGNFEDLEKAFILPHKLFFTLDEAKILTSLPKSYLRQYSEKICGRILIRREKLDLI